MYYCYLIVKNYGLAILIFTIISKIVLLPLSIWVQKNSIKMVKMMPAINNIKIKFFGDKDRVAEETQELYKKEKYNPLASIVPLIIQIVILIGLIDVINHPVSYITKVPKNLSDEMIKITLNHNKDLNSESSSLEVNLVEDIKSGKYDEEYLSLKETFKEYNVEEYFQDIKNLNLSFLGFNLGSVASSDKGLTLLVPLIAGLSAFVLCICQNRMNVLQKQQSNAGKYGTMLFSVGLSLYLGYFVVAGVALYWVISNLLAILQQFLLNKFINPRKYVDYKELEKTQKELDELELLDKKNNKLTTEEKKKQKQDYKKFFKVVNKHLVFYSESNGFYKYYKGIIEYLLEHSKLTIHYITSDYHDNIFNLEKEYPNRIKAYFIAEKKLITLMMKMDADVVVMTMPDIENYHIKRSYVRKDIEYIFIPHSMGSLNLTMRYQSMDHYDTIFAVGIDQKEELLKENKLYGLNNRKIVECGYVLLDQMIEDYEKNKKQNKEKTVLIAPSWQKDNIVDLCLDELLDELKGHDYKIIVRPHPQHVRHMKEKFEGLKKKFANDDKIEIQTDFSSNNTVFDADLVITDWSSIGFEYAFTTLKPVLFIDTPVKVMNNHYEEINKNPFNIWIRKEIGEVVSPKKLKGVDKVVDKMLKEQKKYSKSIELMKNKYVFNIGTSKEVGAKYIIKSVQEKIKSKKEE